jgi:probable HAF family extracellular repeat protein
MHHINVLKAELSRSFDIRKVICRPAVPGGKLGINNSGQIVGQFEDATGLFHDFMDTNGNFTTLDPPFAGNSPARGINNRGQVVGYSTETVGVVHGFLATPTVVPEPGSLPLLAACLIGLGAMARYRKRARRGFAERPIPRLS